MELAIKISEEEYDKIKENDCGLFSGHIYQMIRNGKPIPKGHGDLIDVNDLMPDSDYEDGIFYAVSIGAIGGAPKIIEADMERDE